MTSTFHGTTPETHVLERTHRLAGTTSAIELVDMAFEDYADAEPRPWVAPGPL